MSPTPCLLCAAPAVADGLCVPDGARKWAAELTLRDYEAAACWRPVDESVFARADALDELFNTAGLCEQSAHALARAFLDRLAVPQEERTRREALAAAEDARREAMR